MKLVDWFARFRPVNLQSQEGKRRLNRLPRSRQIQCLEQRTLLSVAQFAGTYRGAFVGSVNDGGFVEGVPGPGLTDNSIEATISGTTLTVNVPGIGGTGIGTINASGSFDVTASGGLMGGGVDVRYTGSLTQTISGVVGSGSWSIVGGSSGSTGAGTWTLSRLTQTTFDGNYSGSYTGSESIEGVGSNIPIPGPTLSDNSLSVVISNGLVRVYVPGIDGGGTSVIFPSGGGFSVPTTGSVGGDDVSVTYSGSFFDDGLGNVTGSGTWQIVNTPGVTGSGVWQLARLANAAPTVNLGNTGGTSILRFDAVTKDLVVADSGGAEMFRQSFLDQTTIVVNGGSSDDNLILDFSNGSPIPSGGLTFNGGGQGTLGDAITLTGTASFVTHSFLNGSSGSITGAADIGFQIDYTGLEPIFDQLDAGTRTFIFGDAVDVVTLADEGTTNDGSMTISSSTGTSESVTFTITSADLAI